MFGERFWLREGDGPWREVDKQQYVEAERLCGFHNTMGQPEEPATAAFSKTFRDDEKSIRLEGTTLDPAKREAS